MSVNYSLVAPRIAEWKERLIDLSKRNKLIYFQETKRSSLLISEPHYETIFNRLVVDEKAWKIYLPLEQEVAEDENTEGIENEATNDNTVNKVPINLNKNVISKTNIENKKNTPKVIEKPKDDEIVTKTTIRKEIEQTLKNLYRRSQLEYQEKGIRILYIAFGLLNWKDKDSKTNTNISTPLLLCPIELKVATNNRSSSTISLPQEFDIKKDFVLNPALQVKLKRDFDLDLPEVPDDWEEVSLNKFFDQIDTEIKQLKAQWSLERSSLISCFSFHKLVMYQDLDSNTEYLKSHPVIRKLVGEYDEDKENDYNKIPTERELDLHQKPSNTFQILDADSSQQTAIQAALFKQSLVLQGPPGTGKSQTITNIISEFIANGQTVLFVSEKIAALEVVFKRLREAGLEDLCLELHSNKVNKLDVILQLKKSLDQATKPDPYSNKPNFAKIQFLKNKLNTYVEALHKVREPLGQSVYKILTELSKLTDTPSIDIKIKNSAELDIIEIQKLKEPVSYLPGVWQVIEQGKNFSWFGCQEKDYDFQIKAKWTAFLHEIQINLSSVRKIAKDLTEILGLSMPLNLLEVKKFLEVCDLVLVSPYLELNWILAKNINEINEQTVKYKKLCTEYLKNKNELSLLYKEGFFDLEINLWKELQIDWENIKILLPFINENEKSFLENRQKLLNFLKITCLFTKEINDDINLLNKFFGNINDDLDIESINNFASLAMLLNHPVKPLNSWINPFYLEQVKEFVTSIRSEYEFYNTKKKDLLSKYHNTLLETDINLFLEQIFKLKENYLSLSLTELQEITDFILSYSTNENATIKEFSLFFKNWRSDFTKIWLEIGIEPTNYSINKSKEIIELVNLITSEGIIEPIWLEPIKLQQTKSLIKNIRSLCEEFQSKKKELLKSYTDSFLDLTIDSLIEDFSSIFHTSFIKWINPNFHKNKKIILRSKKQKNLPKDVLDDLSKAQEVVKLGKEIAKYQTEIKALFGSYSNVYELDFGQLDVAINKAEKIVHFIEVTPIPDKIINFVCLNKVSSDVLQSASNVANYIQKWGTLYEGLLSHIPIEDLTLANKLISIEKRLQLKDNQAKELLGQYYAKEATNFALLDTALSLTTQLLDLSSKLNFNSKLEKVITNPSDTNLYDVSKNTIHSIKEWLNLIKEMFSLVSLKPSFDVPPPTIWPLKKITNWAEMLYLHMDKFCHKVDKVLSLAREQNKLSISSLIQYLKVNEELQNTNTFIKSQETNLTKLYGKHYAGIHTDWNQILRSFEWIQKIQKLLTNGIDEKFALFVTNNTDQIEPLIKKTIFELKEDYKNLLTAISKIENLFLESKLNNLSENSLESINKEIVVLENQLEELKTWTDFKKAVDKFNERNFSDFLIQIQKLKPPISELENIFYKCIYENWIKAIFEQDTILKDFDGRYHEENIKEFQENDLNFIQSASKLIMDQCNYWRPRSSSLNYKDTEMALLLREAAKKRKHLPIRELLDRISNLIFRLKPCFLMSPLSVSQFLKPGRLKFDLVIFDEASQVFTEESISSIYRGSQVIIAGDSKQLPPTEFFASLNSNIDELNEDINEEEDSSSNYTSVLDEFEKVPGIPTIRLRWHYRSKHESLIKFSNKQFYDSNLITFPSALNDEKLGVKFIYVENGIYDRGSKRDNPIEAEKVAEEVLKHFKLYPNKSLGVVAFSQAHMTAIEDKVDMLRKQNPAMESFFKDDRLEGFFVKNLENVQGDERDVIILSIGYGKDKTGRMAMNFGPLNRQGGEKRLNVAITRAREKVIVVTSIKASDISESAKSMGVSCLKNYLYNASIDLSTDRELINPLTTSLFSLEQEIAKEIEKLGFKSVIGIGNSEYKVGIGVLDPHNSTHFILGIECDGLTYASGVTTRDRDRLRHTILERVGWSIHKIWAIDWVNRRDVEIKRLKSAIEKAHSIMNKSNKTKM